MRQTGFAGCHRFFSSDVFQSGMAFAVKLGAGLASYSLFAIVSRASGPEEFGIFSIYFSAAMIIGIAGSFGQQVFLVKQVPKARVAADPGLELGVYYFSFVTTLIGAGAGALLFVCLSGLFTVAITTTMLFAGALLCFAFTLSQTTLGALRVQNRTLFAISTRDLLWRILSLVFILGLTWQFFPAGQTMSSGLALLVLGLTLMPILVMHCVFIFRDLKKQFVNVRLKIDKRSWLGNSAGLALIAVISSADLYLYTIVLGFLVPAEQSGVFFASLKTVELLNLFLMAVTLVIAPELSSMISRGDKDQLQRKCNNAIVLQGFPAILAGGLILIASPLFLWFFDPSYVESSNLLRLLVVGMLINALTGATVLLLQLGGLHWRQVAYQGGSLLVAVALLPMLVSMFGLMGAAVSFIISKSLWNILAVITIRAKLNVDPSILALFARKNGGLGAVLTELRDQVRLSPR